MAFYFDSDPRGESSEKLIRCDINGSIYNFYTDNNVFSKKYLDFGTRTLLDIIDINEISGDILDMGCGYGPIGIYIKKNCKCSVDMVDINKRAINLSIKNAKLNGVDVNVFESDIYSNVNKKYDFIITNPPVRVGKNILYKILMDARNYLKSDGVMYLVINKDQGAKSLKRDLEEYYDVTTVKKNKGFYVFKCSMH